MVGQRFLVASIGVRVPFPQLDCYTNFIWRQTYFPQIKKDSLMWVMVTLSTGKIGVTLMPSRSFTYMVAQEVALVTGISRFMILKSIELSFTISEELAGVCLLLEQKITPASF